MTQEGAPGRLVGGRYRLVAEVGSGGMGRVWEGRDELLGRPVAVKEVRLPDSSAAARGEVLARAQREGRNAAALADHPNVVTVYDVVIEDGVPWTVMQLVRGRSLRAELAHGPLDPGHVTHIAAALLSALRAADDAAVVHRDIKPGNVLLADDGRVLLADFGIARVLGDETITAPGAFVGSFEYTSPERADGRAGGVASDLFSLGVTLFHAVEGAAPFRRDSRSDTLSAVLLAPLPEMTRATGGLRELITALTAKDPAERPGVEVAMAVLGGRLPAGRGRGAARASGAGTVTGTATVRDARPRPGGTVVAPPAPAAALRPPEAPHSPDAAAGRRANRLPVVLAGVSSLTVVLTVGVFLLTHPGGHEDDDAPAPPPAVATSALPPSGGPGPVAGPDGTCLDVHGGDGGPTAVGLRGCRSSASGQRWVHRPGGSLEALDRCLGPVGDGGAQDTAVELQDCTGADGQRWEQREDGSLLHPGSARCLEPAGPLRDGVPLRLHDCDGAADQKFALP
ncbi:serine/threonine protein kinase [Streptomyces catenulae]|uniref:non-specific serine/threonine protein kinase n=1 Tax=Streptomyces catenulae TaxID=66875 RepID=A0ABV2YS95_9ACTN|nr:serine/threonine protein kinase [Streptomyces catenulae]